MVDERLAQVRAAKRAKAAYDCHMEKIRDLLPVVRATNVKKYGPATLEEMIGKSTSGAPSAVLPLRLRHQQEVCSRRVLRSADATPEHDPRSLLTGATAVAERFPAAELIENVVGNLVIMVDDVYIGYLNLRTGEPVFFDDDAG